MNTALELWFDDVFLVKRLKEQEVYLLRLQHKFWYDELNYKRYVELRDSALFVKARIEHQLRRPNSNLIIDSEDLY